MPGPALRPRARPEANLRREHQGRALDAVRRLDRDQPAQGRGQQDPHGRFRQLQDPGRSPTRPAAGWGCSAARNRRSRARTRSGPGRWPACPRDQELVEDKLRTLTDALGDLKIVGVRPQAGGPQEPRPGGPQADSNWSSLSLQNKGFFLTQARAALRPGRRARLDRRGGRLHAPLRRADLRRGR